MIKNSTIVGPGPSGPSPPGRSAPPASLEASTATSVAPTCFIRSWEVWAGKYQRTIGDLSNIRNVGNEFKYTERDIYI